MKRLAVMMLAFASSLAAADYSGIWNGKGTVQSARYPGGVPYTVQMTILQAGNSFNGTLKVGNNTPLQVSNGSVSGTGLSFRASLASFQVTGQLSANAGQLSGQMTLSDGTVFTVGFTQQ